VREWISADNDLKDITGALLPSGAEPSREQLLAVASAMRNVVLRHAAIPLQRVRPRQLDVPLAMPRLQVLDTLRGIAALEFLRGRPGPEAGDRGQYVPCAL